MSAPDTNTEKQKEAHKAPLRIGIALPIIFALSLLGLLIFFLFVRGDTPQGAETQIDGRTGDAVSQPIGQ